MSERYPILKEGDRVYFKSTVFTAASPGIVQQVLASKRIGTVLSRCKRYKGKAPEYKVSLNSATPWRQFKVDARHLLKMRGTNA